MRRIQQLAEIRGRGGLEQATVLGEERRLSLMKVSVASKLTTRSSLSIWPKSGLTVAVVWNCPFGQKMSAPPSKVLPPCTLSYRPET
jgi:hypothetical protein